MNITTANIIFLALGAVMSAAGFFLRKRAAAKYRASGEKKDKKGVTGATILLIAGLWFFVEKLLQILLGPGKSEEFTVEIWAKRVMVGSYSLSTTVILTWILMAVLILGALAIHIFVVPKMTDKPHGIQNVLEICVEEICKYTKTNVGDLGDNLPAYLFSIAVFMIGCSIVELFGYRSPTADITMTFAMAFITFVLINYYGIRRKGLKGRIHAMAQPTPIVFPMKIVTDCALPVSMACRLFGNMLGGMIVMDLLYSSLGSNAVGFPSLVGLYFNVFHPLIQAFIFITLTLTFINEAVE